MRLIGLVMILGLAAPLVAGANDAAPPRASVIVGDGTINGLFLKPYNNVWAMTAHRRSDGKTKFIGLWTDHLEQIRIGEIEADLRVQGMTYVNGITSATYNAFDPTSLRPYWSQTNKTTGEVFHRDFSGKHITSSTSHLGANDAQKHEFDLPSEAYDFDGGMYGLVLAGLPLKPGLTGTIPSIAEFDDVPVTRSYRVLREEDISAGPLGKVKAWAQMAGCAVLFLLRIVPNTRSHSAKLCP